MFSGAIAQSKRTRSAGRRRCSQKPRCVFSQESGELRVKSSDATIESTMRAHVGDTSDPSTQTSGPPVSRRRTSRCAAFCDHDPATAGWPEAGERAAATRRSRERCSVCTSSWAASQSTSAWSDASLLSEYLGVTLVVLLRLDVRSDISETLGAPHVRAPRRSVQDDARRNRPPSQRCRLEALPPA